MSMIPGSPAMNKYGLCEFYVTYKNQLIIHMNA